jgi:hypothetical protein
MLPEPLNFEKNRNLQIEGARYHFPYLLLWKSMSPGSLALTNQLFSDSHITK